MLINVLNMHAVIVSPPIACSLLDTSDLAMDSTYVAREVVSYVYNYG
jgi:hypothetical protein